jgi:hypothetical protein
MLGVLLALAFVIAIGPLALLYGADSRRDNDRGSFFWATRGAYARSACKPPNALAPRPRGRTSRGRRVLSAQPPEPALVASLKRKDAREGERM